MRKTIAILKVFSQLHEEALRSVFSQDVAVFFTSHDIKNAVFSFKITTVVNYRLFVLKLITDLLGHLSCNVLI